MATDLRMLERQINQLQRQVEQQKERPIESGSSW